MYPSLYQMDKFTVKRDKTFRKTAARNKIALDLILSRTDVISACRLRSEIETYLRETSRNR